MNQPSGQIIQIGACVGDLSTGDIVDSYSALIKIDEPLTPFIVKLTGIADARLSQDGIPLIEAFKGLRAFCEKHPDRFLNPLTWGGGDSQELKEQVGREYDKIIIGKTFDWPFGRRWLDVKTIYQANRFRAGEKPQAGLAKAMTRFKLAFQGRKHDALDDARNTFRLFHYLVKHGH